MQLANELLWPIERHPGTVPMAGGNLKIIPGISRSLRQTNDTRAGPEMFFSVQGEHCGKWVLNEVKYDRPVAGKSSDQRE
jgi:hypothetical protein